VVKTLAVQASLPEDNCPEVGKVLVAEDSCSAEVDKPQAVGDSGVGILRVVGDSCSVGVDKPQAVGDNRSVRVGMLLIVEHC